MDQPQYTAPAQTTPPKPVATPAPKPKDPVQQLIDLQKQNQELLQTIAENSELQLAAVKSQGRQKIYGIIIKYVFYGIIFYYSIVLTPKLIDSITGQMLGNITGQADVGGAVDPENIQNILEGLDLNAILGN